jgi:hypothetical protein
VSPPWVLVNALATPIRSRPGTLVTCGDKSGGRQPAVGVGNALATALPLTHGRPSGAVPIGGRSRVQRRRERPTVVPTRAAVIFTSLCSRAANPRGANAPRSCVARMHVCWGFTISGAGALANHGGLTPPALGLYMRLCIGKVAILSAQDGLVLSDLRSVFSEQGSLLVHSVSCACPGSSKVCVHPGFRTISAIRPVTAHGRRAFEQVTLPDVSDASMPPNPRCRVQGRG